MRKNKKIFGLIACSAVLAGAVSLGAANVNVAPASAEGASVTFEMAQSASVKYGNEAAIRFAATVSKSYLDTLGTTVKLVSSIDKMGNTDAGEAKTREWIVKGEGSTYVSGYDTNTYYHSITFTGADIAAQIKKAAAVDLTATMWLEDGEGKALTEKQSVTRSMRSVANAIYDQVDSEKQTELGKYVGTRTNAAEDTDAFAEVTVGETATTINNLILPEGFSDYTYVYAGMDVAGTVDTTTSSTGTINAVKTLGATETLSIFDDNNNVYNVPAMYVTNVIETGTEFATIFGAEAAGYYALANDLGDADNLVKCSLVNNDFTGTFDGNGYSIYANAGLYGMFGKMMGATVKNVGIYVLDWQYDIPASANFNYRSVFCASNSTGGTFENIYVNVDADKSLKWFSLIPVIKNATNTGFFLKDIIFELNDDPVFCENQGFGLIHLRDQSLVCGCEDNSQNFVNVNVITTQKVLSMAKNGNYAYVAQNDTAVTKGETEALSGVTISSAYQYGVTCTAANTHKNRGRVVNRYDSATAMYSDEAARQVGNWTVSEGGAIAWGAIEEEIPDEVIPVDYAYTVNFSTSDGTLPLTQIFGKSVTVTEAWQGETQLTVEDNKISGLQVSDTEITETTITVYTATEAYNIPVKACTKWISTAAEFKALFDTAGEILGYYALANDLGDETTLAKCSDNSSGIFKGTFDGNGYSIYAEVGYYGIFGQVQNATIKNLGIQIRKWTATTAANFNGRAVFCSTHSTNTNTTFENIYVNVDADMSMGYFRLIPVAKTSAGFNFYLKDIVLELNDAPEHVTDQPFALVALSDNSLFCGCEDDKQNFVNVNIITTQKILSMATKATAAGAYAFVAQNDGELYAEIKENGYTDTLTGIAVVVGSCSQYGVTCKATGTHENRGRVVNRYDSAEIMYDDENARQVGNWTVSDGGTIAWTDTVPSGN